MPIATEKRGSLRLSATLLLTGQLLYILVTLFHTGGEANNHPAVFADYARSGAWTAVHVGQFAAMALLTAGLFALSMITCLEEGISRWVGRFAACAAVATLVLYGVLQAVDGVALKQAVNAWASAPDAEKAARFASAETIRWLEWGVRSYQNIVLGHCAASRFHCDRASVAGSSSARLSHCVFGNRLPGARMGSRR